MAAAGIAAAVGIAGRDFTILAGTASPALGAAIAQELGVPVGACDIARYPDGEVAVQLRESVRRKEVFLVQSTAPPVDEHLVELLALADACRRAVALRITAIMPYFGYGRSDKRSGRREPIMGRVVADVLQAVGTGHVVTVDLHTPQIEGFFHAPVDGLTAVPTLCDAMRGRLPRDVVVVSPDAGRVRLASTYARCLGAPVVVLHKRRESATQTAVTHVVGEVAGRACLLVDEREVLSVRTVLRRRVVTSVECHALRLGAAGEWNAIDLRITTSIGRKQNVLAIRRECQTRPNLCDQ